jgi:hypothetical protein
MNARTIPQADQDMERAFDYYQSVRPGLGHALLDGFRRGLDLILEYPFGWQAMDEVYRRYPIRRFRYAIIYRVDVAAN